MPSLSIQQWNINNVPLEIMYEITSYLSLSDLANLQQTNTRFYNLILTDKLFSFYNTVKFFELYYKKRLFAIFLFPYIHPRYTYKSRHSNPPAPAPGDGAESDGMTGNTAFHVAASNGLVDVIKMYLTHWEQWNARIRTTAHNTEALQLISLSDHNQTCPLVDLLNDEPNTPLHYISVIPDGVDEKSVLETARLLIRNGAKIETKGRAGNTVLAEAAQHGQHAMLKLLLDEHITLTSASAPSLKSLIDTRNDYEENAVILSARGHPSVLKTLLDYGGDPNSQRRGYALLHIVCSRFNLDKHDPSSLHQYHNQITSPITWGTPLPPRYTDSHGDTNGNGRSTSGDNRWPNASSAKKHDKTLKFLIQYGADLHRPEESTGMKPMHVAAFWGDQSAIEILSDSGVDPNQELNMVNGWLPVHYACSEGQIFAVQTLIGRGARVWDVDEVEESVVEVDGVLMPPVPRYPFEIEVGGLPEGLHVPAPLELMSFDALKNKIKRFASNSMTRKDPELEE